MYVFSDVFDKYSLALGIYDSNFKSPGRTVAAK